MKRYAALPLALAGLLALPVLASAATPGKTEIGQDENVTEAMFVLMAVIAILLAIAVWVESRKDY